MGKVPSRAVIPATMGQEAEITERREQRDYSPAEVLAIKAIQRFDPYAIEINTYDEIPDFGGGVLVLAEYYHAPEPGEHENDGPYEYQVLVKDGRGSVYQDWSQTLREGSRKAEIISKIASPDVVTAILTFMLVAAYLILVAADQLSGDAGQALGAALTTVLGFWFGRQSRTQ